MVYWRYLWDSLTVNTLLVIPNWVGVCVQLVFGLNPLFFNLRPTLGQLLFFFFFLNPTLLECSRAMGPLDSFSILKFFCFMVRDKTMDTPQVDILIKMKKDEYDNIEKCKGNIVSQNWYMKLAINRQRNVSMGIINEISALEEAIDVIYILRKRRISMERSLEKQTLPREVQISESICRFADRTRQIAMRDTVYRASTTKERVTPVWSKITPQRPTQIPKEKHQTRYQRFLNGKN